jgi:hypothetical protein
VSPAGRETEASKLVPSLRMGLTPDLPPPGWSGPTAASLLPRLSGGTPLVLGDLIPAYPYNPTLESAHDSPAGIPALLQTGQP